MSEYQDLKTSAPKTPRWQRKKDDRPQEILDAAIELFVDQGFSATKVSQIARKAGVTPGTLYVYFKNKEAILQEVVMKTLSQIFDEGNAILESYEGTSEGLVKILLDKWWEAVGSGSKISGIPKLIISEVSNFPELADFYFKRILNPTYTFILQVLMYGIKKGDFQIADVNATTYMIFATCHGAVIDAHSFKLAQKNNISMDAFKDHLLNIILHGILKVK
ncbi:MAG: TetR/AcrR family transcriptional regulator [Hallerella porci]|uniref:TetR family transcriptional regulator n=1 Tax=Hallerella porci TaxID=1945871 RepID=A0ABX5LM29_9BACT|nr:MULTISPECIES: TetR/AcrR family transcriptional regulator [Hallerella]MCI5599824.1 TetR/AcrR family transcriptional regulator [Hallerella sp.]MDY3922096.1 TetR/AcrR family transcriptional regulator [Hallerella porci]PWL03490.1 TetR family transcriptional regulator [Hallerella porci]